jgi:hypothetical protein
MRLVFDFALAVSLREGFRGDRERVRGDGKEGI